MTNFHSYIIFLCKLTFWNKLVEWASVGVVEEPVKKIKIQLNNFIFNVLFTFKNKMAERGRCRGEGAGQMLSKDHCSKNSFLEVLEFIVQKIRFSRFLNLLEISQ